MGLFLACSGIVGAGQTEVQAAYSEFLELPVPKPFKAFRKNRMDAPKYAVAGDNVTVVYPEDFLQWDDASKYLSSKLRTAVFSFHIHDGDLWMFTAFNGGDEVTRFNPLPEYWDDGIAPEEMKKWAGDASLVASLLPGKNAQEFSPYFLHWTDEVLDGDQKALPDDEFPSGDCWQLVDFMRRCGFAYPQP